MRKMWKLHIVAMIGFVVLAVLALGSATPPPQTRQPWAHVSTRCCFTVGIRTDGSLWAWGGNEHGQLGDGTRTSRPNPVRIGTANDWAYVSAGGGPGSDHTVAIRTDGTLWAWGWNDRGQLGDGTTTSRSSPIQIGAMTNWASVSASFVHTMAIRTDGTLWAWGSNEHGQLGDGTTTQRNAPVQIGTDTNWLSVSAGDISGHTVAIRTDGTLWAWGNNANGRTGFGTDYGKTLVPMQVSVDTELETGWAFVSAGWGHTVAIRTDGSLWAWGTNASGRTGLGTDAGSTLIPTQIGTATDWALASAGWGHTVAIRTNGTLWAWGINAHGQLGDGTATARIIPIQTGGTATGWASVSTGGTSTALGHTVALRTDGSLWTWGSNVRSPTRRTMW